MLAEEEALLCLKKNRMTLTNFDSNDNAGYRVAN